MMTHSRVAGVDHLRCEALPKRDVYRRRHLRGGTEQPGKEQPSTDTGGYRQGPAAEPSWPPRNLLGLRVLVIDDDEASLDYFAVALKTAGAAVTTASNATDGLRLAQEHRPDVILTDIAMPDHDGYWLLREIRKLSDATLRAVPVVAATAFGRAHSRETVLAAGFSNHLSKPVEPDRLCATIAEAGRR